MTTLYCLFLESQQVGPDTQICLLGGKVMNPTNKAKFRQSLIERRNHLAHQLMSMEESVLGGAQSGSSPTHMADISGDNFDQDMNIGLLEKDFRIFRQINEAIERIDDPNFGVCESCQREIGLRRLEHVPYARLCVNCQRRAESNNFMGFY